MSQPTNGANGHREDIHWPSLVAAISAISVVGIAIGLGLPLLSIILEKRGIPSTLIGLNSAMAGIAAMIAAPITTKLAHRLGVAPTMLWAVVLSAISALGFYYAEAFWMWFPLRIVFHGATTTLFILSEFWINAAAPPSRRGLVLGIYATVLSVGFASGPLLFSILGSDGVTAFRGRRSRHSRCRHPDLYRPRGKPGSRRLNRNVIFCAIYFLCPPQPQPCSYSALWKPADCRSFRSTRPVQVSARRRRPFSLP